MIKLTVRILIETIIGLTMAAVLLAVAVPLMIRLKLIVPGDIAGSLVVTGTLVCAIGGMLFRPGSAINRYGRQ